MNKKMSVSDKITRTEKKLGNLEKLEDIGRECRKIRLHTLRKLLLLYYLDAEAWKLMGEGSCPDYKMPQTIEGIQDILKCGNREAYDFYWTMFIISQFKERSTFDFYKAQAKLIEMERKEESKDESLDVSNND